MSYGNEKFDKRWEITSVQVASPAAGSDWSYTVPSDKVVKLKGIIARLTNSGTVASRTPVYYIKDDAGNVVLIMTNNLSLAAGVDAAIVGYHGTGIAASTIAGGLFGPGQANPIPIPLDLVLKPSWVIGSSTGSIQTGDTWTKISLVLELADQN